MLQKKKQAEKSSDAKANISNYNDINVSNTVNENINNSVNAGIQGVIAIAKKKK